MPLSIPPELKKVTPFVRRAEELDRDTTSPESRLVAYYCRQYAVHIGIPLTGSSPDAKACLGHLLGSLEQEKPAMDNFTRDESTFLCRKFANQVFDKTDAEDREGRADKNTAKAFYAAATFFEILQQFSVENDTSEEVAEDKRRILYSKWKATEILKAIKEGRQPQAGGHGEEMEVDIVVGEEIKNKLDAPTAVVTVNDDDDESVELVKSRKDTPISPSIYPLTPMPPPQMPQHGNTTNDVVGDEGTEVELGPPPAYPGEDFQSKLPHEPSVGPKITFDLPPPVETRKLPHITMPVVKSPTQDSTKAAIGNLFGFAKKTGGKASKAQIADAVELTKFALAALEEKDGDLAADRMQQALQALGR